MRDYVIISDSTTDLSPEILKEIDVEILPLSVNMNGKVYQNYPDERDLSCKEFYKLTREGVQSTTSQINLSTFDKVFAQYVKEGKDIIYLAFSSGLSGTYNSARIAAQELLSTNKEAKIAVIDSLCASMGEGLLLYYAAKKRDQGACFDEIVDFVEENKLKLCHWFTVDDLFHLKRGGRVSSVAAIMGTALGIKPVLHVDNEGHLIPMQKVRGRKQSLDKLVERLLETGTQLEKQTIFISHGDCEDDAKYVAKQIRKNTKVKDIKINYIGPVIGAHSGPGTVALFFLGKER